MKTLMGMDTVYVLNGDYTAETIRAGLFDYETPIFDHLAAERFARQED